MSKEKPFHVYRQNPTILVFKFDHLGATASRLWSDYILKYNGQYPNPLRVLYDFSDCGPPSRYWIQNQDIVLPKLILPANTRNAYLIPSEAYRVWIDVFLSRVPVPVGQLQAFSVREQAIEWLMQGIELVETPDTDSQNRNEDS